jgi:TonB family protein
MFSRSRRVVGPICLSVCLMLAGGSVHAQSTGASAPGAAGAAAADPKAQPLSDVERAKRDADKVFQWIKFHAEKGETKKVEKPDKPEKHESKPESKPQPQLAKAAAPVPSKKVEPDSDSRPVASSAPADAASARNTALTTTAAPSVPTPPAFTGRIPEVVAMAAPATAPTVGTPAAPAQQPEPEPAPLPEEDTPLRLISKVDPEYPRALLSQQRNGAVLVKFVVQTDGSVEAVEAIKSPDRKLSAAAVTAVKQWRFAPVNKPRAVSVEIGFQME